MKAKIILIWVYVFLIGNVSAQSFKDDMDLLKKNMQNTQFDIEYSLFAASSYSKSIQSMRGHYWLQGEKQFFKTKSYMLMNTKEINMVIDFEQNYFLVDRNRSKNRHEVIEAIHKLISDSVISFGHQYKVLNDDNKSRTWEIHFNSDQSVIGKIELKFDLIKKELISVKYHYQKTFNELFNDAPENVNVDDRPIIVIDFFAFKPISSKESDQVFNLKNYYETRKGKLTPGQTYKGFKFINYLNIK